MRTIDRRLRRLEGRFGPSVETEYSRELRRRIEAGRRRVAEARGEAYVPWQLSASLLGSTLAERILRGRERSGGTLCTPDSAAEEQQ